MRSRAAILHDVGGPWSVEEFELDPPKAGEILVEMAAAGLCHSDDHILTGDMSAPNEVMRSLGLPTMFPTIGGHEGSGTGREVGEGVTGFAVGDGSITWLDASGTEHEGGIAPCLTHPGRTATITFGWVAASVPDGSNWRQVTWVRCGSG